MKRWVFNINAVLSLLLLMVTVGLWVDGCSSASYIGTAFTDYDSSSFALVSFNGRIICHVDVGKDGQPFADLILGRQSSDIQSSLDWSILGFGFYKNDNPKRWDLGMAFPHWFLALILAILPTIWFIMGSHGLESSASAMQ